MLKYTLMLDVLPLGPIDDTLISPILECLYQVIQAGNLQTKAQLLGLLAELAKSGQVVSNVVSA